MRILYLKKVDNIEIALNVAKNFIFKCDNEFYVLDHDDIPSKRLDHEVPN